VFKKTLIRYGPLNYTCLFLVMRTIVEFLKDPRRRARTTRACIHAIIPPFLYEWRELPVACRCPPCAGPRMAGYGRLGNLKTLLRIIARRPRMVDSAQIPHSTISKSGYATQKSIYVAFSRGLGVKKYHDIF
jgi:hypothetical protein